MARFFSKTGGHLYDLGINAINPAVDGASAVSVIARAKATEDLGVSATNNRLLNVVIDTTISGILINLLPMGISLGGRSIPTDAFSQAIGTTPVGIGRWFSAGGVLDFGGDAIRIYRDGHLDVSGPAVFANATYTPGTPSESDRLSGNTTATQWPESIEYVALYNVDIGDAAFLDLARGAGPLEVQAENLVFYIVPGRGRATDIDVVGGIVPTLTGSLPIVPSAPNRQSFADRFAWRRAAFAQRYPAA